MRQRMRHVLNREDYEALYWPPDEYPKNTLAAAEELKTRGLQAKSATLDYLVAKGVPFREAHHVTGRAVAFAESAGKALEELTLDELRVFFPAMEQDVFEALRYETAVARRNGPGGTGPESVSAQMAELSRWLQKR